MLLERRNRRTFPSRKHSTYPCGETQEVFYELLFIWEHHPLDFDCFAYSRLERRNVLLERLKRLRLADYHRAALLPLQERNVVVPSHPQLQLLLPK